MSRDSSGTYTRPDNSFSNPTVGETIDPTDAIALFDDQDTALTDSYSRSLKGGMTAAGTEAAPAFTWDTDLNTGMWLKGTDNIGISCAGVKVLDIATTGLDVTGALSATGAISGTAIAASGALSGATTFTLSGDLSPTALSGNVDNYNPTGLSTAAILRIDGGAADRNITGLSGGADGLIKVIINIGATNNLVLKNETTSTAANRFKFGADITLTPDQGAIIWYDSTSSRWRALSVFTTAGGGAGTVTSVAAGDGLLGGTITSSGTLTTGADSRLSNIGFAVSAAAGALTIAMKGADGNDPGPSNPVVIDFRNATGTTGTPAALSVQAATSLVISSGSTLGVVSTTGFNLWIVGFNDGGTFRLGVVKCWNSSTGELFKLIEGIESSTAEGGAGAADSSGVIYTGTAVTSKAMRILGYLSWNASGVTAGTWTTTNLGLVQVFGPGVKLPGDVVRSKPASINSQITTTNTTYTATGLSVTLTPTSAANPFAVYMDAMIGQVTAAAQTDVVIQRGGVPIGGEKSCYNGAGGILTSIGTSFLDFVSATSSQTWEAYYKATAGTAVFSTGATTSHLSVTELMG